MAKKADRNVKAKILMQVHRVKVNLKVKVPKGKRLLPRLSQITMEAAAVETAIDVVVIGTMATVKVANLALTATGHLDRLLVSLAVTVNAPKFIRKSSTNARIRMVVTSRLVTKSPEEAGHPEAVVALTRAAKENTLMKSTRCAAEAVAVARDRAATRETTTTSWVATPARSSLFTKR